jgi:hypothetical protein
MKMVWPAFVLALVATAILEAHAQSNRMPLAQGVWVKTDTQCGAAVIAYVYSGSRFGSIYFYGPNHSMGPANETEIVAHVAPGKDGFSIINDGPIEVASKPNGQAIVRAVSLSEGVQWSETVRLCEPTSLSGNLRAALVQAGLMPRS